VIRPRILQVITRLAVDGAARHVIDVARALRPDFDVVVAAGTEEDSEGSLRQDASRAGVQVRHLASLRRRGSLFSDRRAVNEIAGLIRSVGPALVHTHQAKAGVLGRMAARRAGVRRAVHTFHASTEGAGSDGLLRRANAAAERRLARVTDRLIAVSSALRDELVSQGVAAKERIAVIRPVADSGSLFQPAAPGGLRRRLLVPEGAPLVGMVGRISPAEEPMEFLRIFATVAASVPGARAVVAGDGPERVAFEAEARRRGLHDRVAVTGWAVAPEEAYADLDVLVVLSRYEGFSAAALGAMAAGRAVAAARGPGVLDLLTHEQTGLLAPAGDAGALAGCVILLLNDPAYRERLGAAAREEARRIASEEAAPRLAALYAELLGRPVARRSLEAARAGAVP
jgi:glycosyltransferase involved in cell wall biosynthesis